MKLMTRKLIAALLIFTVATMPAVAAAPNQANINSLLFTGVDSVTGNAAAPVVDHGSGGVQVNTIGTVATYRAVVADLTPAASATDATILCGSATKTIQVTGIEASADTTNPASMDFYVNLRSASDVGGTSAVVSSVALDQTPDSAATASLLKFTANPSSVGAGVLIVGSHYATPAATATGYPIPQWIETFGTRGTKPVVLRGVNQCLAFGFNGATIPAGASVYINWEWTEQ